VTSRICVARHASLFKTKRSKTFSHYRAFIAIAPRCTPGRGKPLKWRQSGVNKVGVTKKNKKTTRSGAWYVLLMNQFVLIESSSFHQPIILITFLCGFSAHRFDLNLKMSDTHDKIIYPRFPGNTFNDAYCHNKPISRSINRYNVSLCKSFEYCICLTLILSVCCSVWRLACVPLVTDVYTWLRRKKSLITGLSSFPRYHKHLLENRVIMITAILLPVFFLKGPIDSFTFLSNVTMRFVIVLNERTWWWWYLLTAG